MNPIRPMASWPRCAPDRQSAGREQSCPSPCPAPGRRESHPTELNGAARRTADSQGVPRFQPARQPPQAMTAESVHLASQTPELSVLPQLARTAHVRRHHAIVGYRRAVLSLASPVWLPEVMAAGVTPRVRPIMTPAVPNRHGHTARKPRNRHAINTITEARDHPAQRPTSSRNKSLARPVRGRP